jgi:hypothetical protein
MRIRRTRPRAAPALALALMAGSALAVAACERSKPVPAESTAPSASARAAAPPAPLVLDEAHSLLGGHPQAKPYTLRPQPVVVLDAGPLLAARRAADAASATFDTLQIVVGQGIYTAKFDPASPVMRLSAETLTPVKGGPFAGFPPGARCALALGRQAAGDADVMARFQPGYGALIVVAGE